MCHTRIQVGKQTEVPLHQINITNDSSPSIADGTRSEAESDMEELSLADDGSSDSDPDQDDTASIPNAAADVDTSKVRKSCVLSESHVPVDIVFGFPSTSINGPTGIVAIGTGDLETMTTTSNIGPAPIPSIQITPPSRFQREETEIAASSLEPSVPTAPTRTLTRLDPEWYNNVIPPEAKPANHPHSKSRPISDYVWTMATVQGAIDACNIQRNMALEMPYLKTMVAIDNYKRGIHGREPTPWELVTALQDLYGYGR